MNMKKLLLLSLVFFVSMSVFSQEDAWVYFKDKPDAQLYYDSPLLMLTQRALDRRTNQNIVLDLKDIPIDPSYISQIKNSNGITVLAKSKWLNSVHVRGTQADINSLALLTFVDRIDFADKTLNQTGKKPIVKKPTKVNKIQKTKVEYAYGTSANQIQMLNGQVLHQQNYTGSGKIIAIMDAGFPGVNSAQPFQRLINNNQILGGYNYVLRDSDFYTGDSHGTAVLSLMAGYKENSLIGTAPDSSYYLFITEDDTSENPIEESLWVEAAEKADSLGVDVINTSLGYFDYDKPAYSHTYSDMDGATAYMSRGAVIAFSRGMIVVAAAGNSNNDGDPNTDSHIAVPADAAGVIAVGAVNSTEVLTSFSSIGPSYDNRTKPDVVAQGQSDYVSDEFGNIVTGSGTSFSSPIMAGMIACLWQAFPNKTNAEIKQLILEVSDRFANPNNQYGYGIPDFSLALSNGLSVAQVSKNDALIYPNPTNDLVSIALPTNLSKGTFMMYTILGQKVLEKNISGQSVVISLKTLNKGIYLYKLESDIYATTGKIIKN